MIKYFMERYDELLVPFNRLAVEIMWDLPVETDIWLKAWKEYVNSLDEACSILFDVGEYE